MHPWNDDRIYQRTCGALKREGHDVWLVATPEERYTSDTIEGINIVRLRMRKGMRRRLLSSWEAMRRVRETGADVIQFHDPELIPWMLLMKLRGWPVIYDIHENFAASFLHFNLPPKVAGVGAAVFRWFERLAVQQFDGIVVVSESLGKMFEDKAKRTVVLHNVADFDRLAALSLNVPKDPFPVIYTSGLNSSARHCLETVLALPQILRSVPDAVVRFAGSYHPQGFREEMLRTAGELGVGSHLDLLPMLPWEENFRSMSRASVGCVFYSDNPNHRIAIANRLFEYMYSGLPVLVEDFPELRRIVLETGCGLVVDSSSPDAIARGAVEILSQPDLALEMGRRGQQAAREKYNLRAELGELVKLFEIATAGNARTRPPAAAR